MPKGTSQVIYLFAPKWRHEPSSLDLSADILTFWHNDNKNKGFGKALCCPEKSPKSVQSGTGGAIHVNGWVLWLAAVPGAAPRATKA